MASRQFSNEGREPWAVTGAEFTRNDGDVDLSAAGALPLEQLKVSDVHGYFGEFKMLMRVVYLGVKKFAITATALNRMKLFDLSGCEKLLAGALMPFLPSWFTMGLLCGGGAFNVGTV
jgi:hypothetical protein